MPPLETAERGQKPQAPEGGPRQYHLLWDEELEALQPILRLVLDHLEEIIQHWYQLYVVHFGDRRSLSEPEFHDIFYNAISRNTKDLLEGDILLSTSMRSSNRELRCGLSRKTQSRR